MSPSHRVEYPSLRSTSVIFASPHSGRDYGWGFLRRSVLDSRTIRSSEDAFVDELFASAPSHGAPLLALTVPRAFVDVNRGTEELDPALIRGVEKALHNPRVTSGLGVIPRVVAGGRPIYRGKIPLAEAEARLRSHWHPYHGRLKTLVNESHRLFGQAILIDCHSMPHEAIDSLCRGRREKPEIVLGDRFGASAAGEIVDEIELAFRDEGFRVGRNTPFAGAFTTQHYGRPSRGQHAIQVEIDRSLYMNESKLVPNGNFASMQAAIDRVIARVAEVGRPQDLPLAAE
ncbi:N-formylglutamate amidohydrolase [Maritimibacter sp. UBA3975]|uniref:N-formylglutamate amidohydrolase n=1 Tax=Maritimibacter sp. UBA3975 TaxID=1946833 RepID=UPI000C0B2D84|nr:N-formylglutamate amidohydrolase [Maritimibacter sp. UBA3975]MAM63643.1 N-formylglutamate amidohydrolase [Maritimibacter sp.]|tara:strand:- start:4517 stop:5377 length:861 start_codon:yes stop_codon:yes gene_type:complete